MEENWSNDRLANISIKTVYEYSKDLELIVNQSPKPYDTWRSVFEDFKPKNTYLRQWLDDGRNRLIQAWVNTDYVFTSLEFPGMTLFTPRTRVRSAYRASFIYAMLEGRVNNYHYKHLKAIDDRDAKEKD